MRDRPTYTELVTELIGTELHVLPAGIYPGIVNLLEGLDTAFGRRLAWRCLAKGAAADGSDFELTGWTSLKTHRGTKAGDWIEAIIGRRLGKGEQLDVDLLIGVAVQLVVKVDEASGFNRIDAILPAQKSTAIAAPDPETEAAFQAFMAQQHAAESAGDDAA